MYGGEYFYPFQVPSTIASQSHDEGTPLKRGNSDGSGVCENKWHIFRPDGFDERETGDKTEISVCIQV